MLRAVRRAGARSALSATICAPAALPCSPLRSRRRPRLVARQPDRPAADDVAVSRADADLRRRRAGDARRGIHAARPRARRSARASACRGCTSRTNRSTRPTRSRRAVSRPRSRARGRSARPRSRCRRRATRATPPPPTRRAPGSQRRSSCLATSSRRSFANASCTAPTSRWSTA